MLVPVSPAFHIHGYFCMVSLLFLTAFGLSMPAILLVASLVPLYPLYLKFESRWPNKRTLLPAMPNNLPLCRRAFVPVSFVDSEIGPISISL